MASVPQDVDLLNCEELAKLLQEQGYSDHVCETLKSKSNIATLYIYTQRSACIAILQFEVSTK